MDVGVLMQNISAYRGRDLQHAAQIMKRCGDEGLSLDECMEEVAQGQAEKKAARTPATPKENCPECGRSLFIPVDENRDPLPVVACRNCRWSRYEVVK